MQRMDQGIRDIFDNCKVITRNGSLLFTYKSTRSLFNDNKHLLDLLEDLTPVSNDIFKSVITPLVTKFAKIVSIAPASKFLHDCDCGGLFRHSLLVAIKAIELYKLKTKHSFNLDTEYILIIFLALLHDIGKVVTDYVITANGCSFHYTKYNISYTLDDFLQKKDPFFVNILFNKKRNKEHEISTAKMLQFLMYGLNNLWTYLLKNESKEAINSLLFSDNSNQYYRLIKAADIYACSASINKYSPIYEIGNYLKLLFLTNVIDKSLPGFYRVKSGYVVEKGSLAHQAVISAFDIYYELLNEYKSFDNFEYQSFEKLYPSFTILLQIRYSAMNL